MDGDLRAYEVTCAWYPNEPRTVHAATGGAARMDVARTMREVWNCTIGEALRLLRVRALSPRGSYHHRYHHRPRQGSERLVSLGIR